jgi:hypothetical protein
VSPPITRQERLVVYLEDESIGLLEDRPRGYVAFTFDDVIVTR